MVDQTRSQNRQQMQMQASSPHIHCVQNRAARAEDVSKVGVTQPSFLPSYSNGRKEGHFEPPYMSQHYERPPVCSGPMFSWRPPTSSPAMNQTSYQAWHLPTVSPVVNRTEIVSWYSPMAPACANQTVHQTWYPPTNQTVHQTWYPPTNLQRYELFEKALMCGEKSCRKKYLAIYWLDFRHDVHASLPSPLFENDKDQHAEGRLLAHLILQLYAINKDRLESITIMLNSSPCSRCADAYRTALRGLVKDCGIKVCIVFSSFHWVRRESCRRLGHHHLDIPMYKHVHNLQGLQQLRQTGFELRTTCDTDWVKLCTALQVPLRDFLRCEQDYHRSQRGQEDHNLRDDLEFLLSK